MFRKVYRKYIMVISEKILSIYIYYERGNYNEQNN